MRWLTVALGACAFALMPSQALGQLPDSPTVETTSLDLPYVGRSGASAVSTDAVIFVFGGEYEDNKFIDHIVRVAPRAREVVTLDAKLPSPRAGTSAVWTGEYAYVFGGYGGSYLQNILRFDPDSEEVQLMDAKLPSGRADTSAIWTGKHAYIFGGRTEDGATREILRYDVNDDEISLVGEIPYLDTAGRSDYRTSQLYGSAAVWDGENAFIFGGETCRLGYTDNDPCDTIVRFNPKAGLSSLLDARVKGPAGYGLSYPAASWTSQGAVIVGGSVVSGGCCSRTASDRILVYDPTLDSVTISTAKLASPLRRAAAVTFEDTVYVIGGFDGEQTSAEILRYESVRRDREKSRDDPISKGDDAWKVRADWAAHYSRLFDPGEWGASALDSFSSDIENRFVCDYLTAAVDLAGYCDAAELFQETIAAAKLVQSTKVANELLTVNLKCGAVANAAYDFSQLKASYAAGREPPQIELNRALGSVYCTRNALSQNAPEVLHSTVAGAEIFLRASGADLEDPYERQAEVGNKNESAWLSNAIIVGSILGLALVTRRRNRSP